MWWCQPQPSLGSADPAPPSASNSSLETGISLPGAASQSLHPALEFGAQHSSIQSGEIKILLVFTNLLPWCAHLVLIEVFIQNHIFFKEQRFSPVWAGCIQSALWLQGCAAWAALKSPGAAGMCWDVPQTSAQRDF